MPHNRKSQFPPEPIGPGRLCLIVLAFIAAGVLAMLAGNL